jgi:hypothetical protein
MDWANWSTARKILLPASLLLLLDSFLDWQQVSFAGHSAGQSMWHGLGFLVGILLLLLIVWELLAAFSPDTTRGWNLPGGLITLALAAGILLFTLIRVLTLDFRHWPAWVGLILAAVITYGGWLRFQESGDPMPSRASMSSGGSGSSSGGSSGTSSGDDMPAAPPPAPPASPGGMGSTTGAGTSGTTTGAPPGDMGGGGMGGGSSDMGGGGSSDREGTPPA